MASYITELADRLARDTLAAMDASGEDRLHVEVAEVLAAASTTLEEEYLTCMRVRLAERRGRSFLERRIAELGIGAKSG
ncbi:MULTISPECIES: hypothetical protein [unclassified Roseivivax]|uniref:hypothetical protein n=1 Tax=Roseivivax sp. GX 12232 TaxID=2900547 RepID=UPI001E3239A0|nr:hypothetical protein [Roseivivax sp. GX 12232]MCE0504623.1 hypothetical protein [Roseivivax sp. GX 12232]